MQFPDSLENLLIQAAQTADTSYWTIGDLTNDACKVLVKSGYKESEVRAYVSNLISWEPDTIRDQQRMSEKIPATKRTYNLSRHQYRACLNSPDWEKYARLAVEYGDDHNGRSAPVNVIREWIKGNKDQTPKWKQWLQQLIDLAEKITRDESTPDNIRTILKSVLSLV
jgi:hypothetical protein